MLIISVVLNVVKKNVVCVEMKFAYHSVILSNAKDLITSTLCIQILHYVQNDTTF